MKFKEILTAIFFTVSVVSCSMQSEQIGDVTIFPNAKAIFVCNQGIPTRNDASLSMYQPNSKFLANNIFSSSNNGVKLGSSFLSMTIHEDVAYAVITNSNLVSVFDSHTIKINGKIKSIDTPRYIAIKNESKGYITSSSELNNITIFDPSKLVITGAISVGMKTDKILIHGNHAYILNFKGNKVLKIDTNNDKIEAVLEIAHHPNSMVIDKHNKLWVLSSGEYTKDNKTPPTLTAIELENFVVQKKIEFQNKNMNPSSLTINSFKEKLMWISREGESAAGNDGGLFTMNINEESIPNSPFISEGNKVFNSATVDIETDEIYITASTTIENNGDLIRYTSTGNNIDISVVGINPVNICFRKIKL